MDSDVETDPSDYSDLEIIGFTNPNPPSTIQCKQEMNIKMEVPSSSAPTLSRMQLKNPPTIKIEQTTTTSLHQHPLFKNERNDSTKLMPALCSDDDYDDSESFNGLKLKKEEMAMDSESSYNPFGTESSDGDDDDEDYIPFIATNKTIKSQNTKKRKRPTPSIKTEQDIQCEICNETFPTWGSHKRHMLNYHDIERPYICYRCPEGPERDRRRYVQRISLVEHWQRDHEKRRDHKCPQCGKGFFDRYSMKAHLKSHENELQIKCEICNEVLHRYIHYRRHMNNVHGVEKAFVCKQCPEGPDRPRYASQAGLNKHIERDHLMIRRFQCQHCPKRFYEEKTWFNHQRVHDGKKPFQCVHCKMRFTVRHSMTDHIKTVHLKQRNFPCEHCGKRFSTATAMKSHVVSQHDDARYARFQCNICMKRFYEPSQYKDHMANKHRPKDPKIEMMKRGECYYPGCGKVYSSGKADSVKYHLVTFHQDRKYAKFECTECGTLFYEMRGYRAHMRSVHGELVDSE